MKLELKSLKWNKMNNLLNFSTTINLSLKFLLVKDYSKNNSVNIVDKIVFIIIIIVNYIACILFDCFMKSNMCDNF